MAKQGFASGSAGKESSCNAGDLGSIPGLGRLSQKITQGFLARSWTAHSEGPQDSSQSQ